MQPARLPAFRYLPRRGHQAVAARDPAQCLPCRICASGRDSCRIRRIRRAAGRCGAAVERGARGAGRRGFAAARCRNDPQPHRESAGRIPRGDRAARNKRFELPRDRAGDRGARRHRDVAPCPRPLAPARRLARGRERVRPMRCEEAEVLLHALIDDELDAGHARAIETHVATCGRCTAQLRDYRDMRGAFARANLSHQTPADLKRRIDARLPAPARPDRRHLPKGSPAGARPDRRNLLKGFAAGAGLSSAIAAGLVFGVMRTDQDSRIMSEVVSAHLRSLQADHLTDVLSSDQHTVKPWFSGRLDVAPPVADLTALGFTLIGGRLDYLDGKPVAALAYRRRAHIINLFVAERGSDKRGSAMETVQGFNVRRWGESGLSLWAISDLSADELEDFGRKFEAAQRG